MSEHQSNYKNSQQSISMMLKNSKYLELRDRSQSASIGTLFLATSYVAITDQFVHFNTFVLSLFFGLIALTGIRLFLGRIQQLNPETWLGIFSVVSASTSLCWALLLTMTVVRSEGHVPTLCLTFLVIAGLISAAAYSLSISLRDYVFFQVPVLVSAATILLSEPQLASIKFGATFIVVIFLVFLLKQRKIWADFWKSQKILSYELQKILDAFPGGISVVQNGIYKRVNKVVLNQLGLSAADVVGKPVGFINKESEFSKLLQQHSGDFRCLENSQHEVIINTPTGPRSHLLIFESTLESSFSNELVVISIDIHDRLEAEKELNIQKAALVNGAKMAALGEMSSGMAHEINNPLTIILGRASLAQMALEKNPLDIVKVSSFIEDIKKTTNRIAKIVKGLKSFARDATNDPFLGVSLGAVISDTLSFCELKFLAGSVKVEVAGNYDDLMIECRPSQISQVLLNALNNSFDAINSLEGDKWIKIEAKLSKNLVTLLVTDCGPGIPTELRQKLMDPFFTTKPVGKGTGLGLSLSQGIIQSHNGNLYFNHDHPNTQLVVEIPRFQSLSKKVA